MKFFRGKFNPKNREKYVGKIGDITYRSSWELRLMNWFDMNPAVVKWNSEGMVIPYFSPIDSKMHRYYVDFLIQYKTASTGELRKALIEVKPYAQTQPPKKTKNKSNKTLLSEAITYQTNMCKWKAASEFCRKNDIDFVVMTEKGAINYSSHAALGLDATEVLKENVSK